MLLTILYIVVLVLGILALVKWFRNSFKKHTLLWVLGILAIVLIVVF